jgi:hypothetical protein
MRAIPREVHDAFVRDVVTAYAFGLWCADGYWWSSSIGVSNVEPVLVTRFASALRCHLPPERLRLRIYLVPGDPPSPSVLELTENISVCRASKMARTAYHLYVNSRPLLRMARRDRDQLERLPEKYLGPYFAGRFDGDGCLGSTPRLSYTTRDEADVDRDLLDRAGICSTSVLYYRKANEYCIYIQQASWEQFERLIEPFSYKVTRRVTP